MLQITGVLGFVIAVFTFVLTRMERRKRLEIELFESTDFDFAHLTDQPEDLPGQNLIRLRFTNISPLPIIIKPETVIISGNGHSFELARHDYWGKDQIEELMPPNSVRELGVDIEWVMEALGIQSPKEYDDCSFNKLYPLVASIEDHKGKRFETRAFSYHEAVGEFIT